MAYTLEQVREARGKVAELAMRNPLLKPVFDRLDREYEAMRSAPRLGKMELEALRRADMRALA